MRLMTAHRILIGTAVAFFIFLGGWELANYRAAGETWAVFRGLLYIGVAVGFACYFVSIRNKVL